MMSSLGVGMVIGSLVSAAWSKPTLGGVIALVELLAVALLAVTVAPDLRLAVLAIAAMGASASPGCCVGAGSSVAILPCREAQSTCRASASRRAAAHMAECWR
jgi:hypothetical protein